MELDGKLEDNQKNSNIKTKYIQIKSLDYWASLYEIDENTTSDLSWVEFNITNDSGGDEHFFWLEFSNISHCTGGDFYYGSEPEKISELIQKLIDSEIDFFVNRAIYPHKERFFAPETFDKSTIFDHKHMESPHYVHIALSEQRPLTPEVLVEWLTKFSNSLFGEQFEFEVTIDYTKMSAEKAYLDKLNELGNDYNKFYTGEYLIKVAGKGSVDFKLGKFMGEIYNSANFPLACCEAFISALQGKLPVAIDFDEDFTQFTLLIDSYNRIYILSHQLDGTEIHKVEIAIPKLVNLFLNDIERDFELYREDNVYYAEGKKNEWVDSFYEKIHNLEKLLNNYRG